MPQKENKVAATILLLWFCCYCCFSLGQWFYEAQVSQEVFSPVLQPLSEGRMSMNIYAQLQSPLLSIVTWRWSKRLRFGRPHGGILLPIQSLLCDMKVSFSLFIMVSVPPGIFSLVSLPLRGSKRPCNLNSLAAPAWVPTTDSHPLWLCIL